jgi:FkbM family methyltransferase
MLRTILERISRRVVLKRRLPARVGGQCIYVSPDAALKFWKRNLDRTDPALFDWASEFINAGDVVWDVGANVGLFGFAAASQCGPNGQVLALEADLRLVEILRRSARSQGPKTAPVVVLPVAVSNEVGVAEFVIAARGRSANHLAETAGSSQTGGARETIMAMTVTLDWLLERFPAPKVLKIDVEGAEHKVLQGAQKLLATHRPHLLCEVHAGNRQTVADILGAHGYTMFDLEALRNERTPLQLPAFNTLALPA